MTAQEEKDLSPLTSRLHTWNLGLSRNKLTKIQLQSRESS